MSYTPYFFNSNATGAVSATGSNFQNASGATMTKGTPASVNTSSQLVLVDVTNQANVQALVGLTGLDLPNGASGSVVDNGRLQNVTTSFSVGDALYIDKVGGLTNIKPSIGNNSFVSGDFVIFVGVLVKNEFNPSLFDIKLMLSMIGQL